MNGTASRTWNSSRSSSQPESLHPKTSFTPLKSNKMVTEDQVSEYLSTHPDYLEKFVLEEVDLEQLERWIIRKSQRLKKRPDVPTKNGRKTSLSRWKFCVHADKRQMLQDLTHSLQNKPTKDHVLWELSNCISSAVGADGFRLYTVEKSKSPSEDIQLYIVLDSRSENGEIKVQKIKNGVEVPKYVANSLEPVRLSSNQDDPRFPKKIFQDAGEIAHIQCQPIIQPNGELVAVLELWRKEAGCPFHEEDEEIAASYLVWGGIALHYAHLYLNMNQQKQLNDFLLAVVKSIFQDMVSMDMLVMKIMNFAQRLVNADRASLFLVDNKNQELYATIFDIGIDESTDKLNGDEGAMEDLIKVHTSKEIRFPLGTGIAGQVAMTGEVLNIRDAYADKRFNRTVDQLTGYTTHTILCMPIYIRGSIIGVVQMVNKQSGFFTKEDEAGFETFAVYCGLALHHAKLYDKIKKSEQKYKVALEVLSYHNTCTEEEFQNALVEGIPEHIPFVDDYYFNPFDIRDYDKAKYSIYMFIDLFGHTRFDTNSLIKFVLTVKKNYRRVPYHNWTHGFSVANSMYCILKRSEGCFKTNERLALFTGALCHDLDHRGKNNKFMSDTESPLAAIYSTSTMEHHHFNQTITILQQEGHNIFSKLSSTDYKQVLGLLKHCILATDLAVFFPNKAKLAKIVEQRAFSWSNTEHRLLLQAISMTGSDLSASAKPWNIQVKTVEVIFEEFYQQGDAERQAGRKPIAMMDREQPDQQPSSQVGFLTGICLPCYNLLNELIPECKPLLDMCQNNLEHWQKIDKAIKEDKNKTVSD
ncbi:probable 3',5'-cyclic phosphodiesterase pde-5 isoform X2 [Anthonomus grandis grandis]|uniref:probable 3',5'-cyclic phosphodiesterase pde-5 isoform X2 n=1 Tax=Anthonomus grandis grandis TaxID=2921223 RepID=UPI002165A9A4|nr:probable 3',5'-cyclic phosphodiesterase pde-5 isoform X2 [Anthonomus grandis grandis]